ncbi:hypothetical protein [Convivina intestini]|uniref:SHOCT domain-containing protein n=1 Tax=Convivina intestini TaxID=1505726 RepID=A0A2U1D564_9LACO|nr:hypothetical protein [Convivina intestini]PVY82821.1 hypothetical protein C7384_11013 [Convivina intestini]CAH1856506.1 hypothetical protein R078131_01416 [Convivina intestini]CAH1856801.1 hypothetical protein R077811_01335 [Convivina intestini]SDC16024.1 hypothetical protein SAMN05216341_1168 [Leuconostocaceae bacterium R-53105]
MVHGGVEWNSSFDRNQRNYQLKKRNYHLEREKRLRLYLKEGVISKEEFEEKLNNIRYYL